MPRYFFHVHHDGLQVDRIGEELADKDAAWKEATTTAGRLLQDLDGELLLGDQPWRFDVTDEFAMPLFELWISAASSALLAFASVAACSTPGAMCAARSRISLAKVVNRSTRDSVCLKRSRLVMARSSKSSSHKMTEALGGFCSHVNIKRQKLFGPEDQERSFWISLGVEI